MVAGVIGVALGFDLADPIAGLLISVVILRIVWKSIKVMGFRTLDGVEDGVVDSIDRTAAGVPAVREVRDVRARWIGHTIRSEIEVGLAPDTTVEQAEDIAAEVRHAVIGSVEHVTEVAVEPRASRPEGVASPGSGGSFRLSPPPPDPRSSSHGAPFRSRSGPTITAKLDDGPLKGQRIETEIVEGRAPSTIDATADDGSTCRYVLAEWTQSGPSAAYVPVRRVGYQRLALDPFRSTASRTRALNAASSMASPSWKSIARRTLPSRLELKRPDGSSSAAPLANVTFTAALYDSPVQSMPSWYQVGTRATSTPRRRPAPPP